MTEVVRHPSEMEPEELFRGMQMAPKRRDMPQPLTYEKQSRFSLWLQ